MYAKIVCLAIVFVTCECNASRIVYIANSPAARNTSGSIPIGPFTNFPSSDQNRSPSGQISSNDQNSSDSSGQTSNFPNNNGQNNRQVRQVSNNPTNVQNSGVGPLTPADPRGTFPVSQLSNPPSNDLSNVPLGLPSVLPSDVQDVALNLPSNLANIPPAILSGNPQNAVSFEEISDRVSNIAERVQNIGGLSNELSVGELSNLPGSVQNNDQWSQILRLLNIIAQNRNLSNSGSQNSGNGNSVTQNVNNGNIGSQNGNNASSGLQSGNNVNSGSQSSSNSNSGSQSGNSGNSGSQTANSGNSGSQSGNNAISGSQIGNSANSGSQSSDSNMNAGLQSGSNGESNDQWSQILRFLNIVTQNRNLSNSGSQNSDNGNFVAQNVNNGNFGSQNGTSGNSGPQTVNSGNSGSQSGNNANSGSQIGNNANSGSQSGDINVNSGLQSGSNGESILGNGGSQSNSNGNAGSQSGNSGTNGLSNVMIGQMGSFENTPFIGSSDDERNIERPCHVSFTECIRQYFAQNAKCLESHGPVPDPLIRPVSTTYLTRINLTLSGLDVIYSGLNGNVEEFYVNKETDRLVITIQFRNVTFYSKDTQFRFYRRAKEPVTNVDYLFMNFRSFSTTTVIPCVNDLQLDKSETYAFVDDGNPRVSIGPKAFASSDQGVRNTLPAMLADMPTNVQEFFLTEAAFYATTYIQYNICNFGLELL